MIDQQRFIPFASRDVARMAAQHVPEEERAQFRQLTEILSALTHMEYHGNLERLKEAYVPFAVNSDLRDLRDPMPRDEAQAVLLEELTGLLEDANFEPISEEELEGAFEEESLLRIRLHVDFDDFAEVLFYRRGITQRTEEVKELYGLRRRQMTFTTYERVVVYVRFHDADHFADDERDELPFEPGSTLVKLFQNVPRSDLESLFPNVEVGMRTLDKLILGVPAAVSGIVLVVTKLLSSLGLVGLLVLFWLGVRDEPVTIDQAALVALLGGLGAFGSFVMKQWNNFKNRKIQFMKQLSENLYFRNVDNDVGVFFHLLDAAEEEEVKEALLAYAALRREGPLTAAELDAAVESWLAEEHDCRLDFEISDALGDLQRLELVEADGERFTPVEPAEACRRLDQRWDELFAYHDPSVEWARS